MTLTTHTHTMYEAECTHTQCMKLSTHTHTVWSWVHTQCMKLSTHAVYEAEYTRSVWSWVHTQCMKLSTHTQCMKSSTNFQNNRRFNIDDIIKILLILCHHQVCNQILFLESKIGIDCNETILHHLVQAAPNGCSFSFVGTMGRPPNKRQSTEDCTSKLPAFQRWYYFLPKVYSP